MGKRFLRLSALGAALTANGLQPIPRTTPLAIPSFFAGWLTTELAVQNLAVTAVGTASYLAGKRARRRPLSRSERIALGLNAASAAGLAALISQGLRVRGIVEQALTEGLGEDYFGKLDPAPDKADLTTPWRQVLMPWQTKHPDVKRIADIPYTEPFPAAVSKPRRNLLDVYQPRQPGENRPVLLQIHGGGWVIGEKEQQGQPLMSYLASHGWVCVAPNYPLSPKATWPEHLIAVKRALVWTREHIAEYGGDPDFIAVTGGSAGGHLAAMIALTPNESRYQPGFETVDTTVAACVPFYGAYDLANVLDTRVGEREFHHYLSKTVFKSRDKANARSASPVTLARADAPPFFVIHGAHDSLVDVAEARELVAQLRKVSASDVVYAELPGAQHAFDVFASVRSAAVIQGVERFLRGVHRDAGQPVPSDSAGAMAPGESDRSGG
ncbi:MAG TPA: alpha/beta hydrolase [Mycobacteriales bacterium]|nr:alpha/beta hydrolase [Mycobacteriales bacterium]